MTYFTGAESRCPHPHCNKPGLCRKHRDQLPESILDTFDYRQMANFFKYRLRLNHLTAEPPQLSSAALGEDAAPAPTSGHGSTPTGETGPLAVEPAAPLRLKTVCAFCKELIHEGPEPISHGCCEKCLAIKLAELDEVSA